MGMNDAILAGPCAETFQIVFGGEGQGQVLVPGHRPIALGILVQQQGPDHPWRILQPERCAGGHAWIQGHFLQDSDIKRSTGRMGWQLSRYGVAPAHLAGALQHSPALLAQVTDPGGSDASDGVR